MISLLITGMHRVRPRDVIDQVRHVHSEVVWPNLIFVLPAPLSEVDIEG
ncbi:MAG TPA: hypothetical protein VFR74_07655 [Jiangellales bacterium]|nr:hypothetical protein [Jiangellales bacterium]